MWGWFGGGAAAKKNGPKKAIIDLREQLDMLTKRERHLEQQIADQDAIARKNISTNKNRRSRLSTTSGRRLGSFELLPCSTQGTFYLHVL